MYIVFVVVAAVVVFAVAAAAVGHGDGLEEPFPDMERPYLPDGRVEPVDIDDVHFAVAFRGYRMEQVDTVLDRLAEELIKRDQHISRLERIVHAQTVQSAVGYGNNRSNRVGVDTGSMPAVQNDQVNSPAEPRKGQPDDTSG
ncbi:MAG TPA: DivIVA domain-containing protein [Jiangellaceae bacterium]